MAACGSQETTKLFFMMFNFIFWVLMGNVLEKRDKLLFLLGTTFLSSGLDLPYKPMMMDRKYLPGELS
jgi:hypothetical protein